MRRLARLIATLLLLLPFLSGCAEQVTQLLVVVESDLDYPAQYQGVKISARGPMGTGDFVREDFVMGEAVRPVSTSIYPLLDEYAPLSLSIFAEGSGDAYPTRLVETSWIPEESRVLYIHLSRNCMDVSCPDMQTCIDGACASPIVDPATLPIWDGEDPTVR